MSYAYAVTRALSGLAATAFTWTPATTTNRAFLNDGRMDKRFAVAATATTVNVVIDMGAATLLKGIALLNSNIASAPGGTPQVQVLAADDAAITLNVVQAKSTTNLNITAPKQKDHVLQFTGAQTKRYWQIIWSWSASAFALQLGELFAFAASPQLTRKSDYGGGESNDIRTSVVEFDTGNSRGYFLGGPVRAKRLPFSLHTESQRLELETLHAAVKADATPFLWIPSYEAVATGAAAAEQEVIYGRLEVNEFAWTEGDYQLFDPSELVIRSLGREVGS